MKSEQSKFVPTHKLLENPESQRKHRREVWWQIYFPLFLIVALIAYGANTLFTGNSGSVESLSQIATMMLILPLLLIGLMLLVLIGGLIYALALLMNWLPPNAFWLQSQIQRISQRSVRAADLLVEPLLRLGSWSSAINQVFRRYR